MAMVQQCYTSLYIILILIIIIIKTQHYQSNKEYHVLTATIHGQAIINGYIRPTHVVFAGDLTMTT